MIKNTNVAKPKEDIFSLFGEIEKSNYLLRSIYKNIHSKTTSDSCTKEAVTGKGKSFSNTVKQAIKICDLNIRRAFRLLTARN